MARIRTIKPEFFTDEDMADLDPLVRLFYVGLWTQADRAGRLKCKPRELKARILPFDDFDADAALGTLCECNCLVRYEIEGEPYLQIRQWDAHQKPHHTERESEIPPLDNGPLTVKQPLDNGCLTDGREGKGKEGKGKERKESKGGSPPAPPAKRKRQLQISDVTFPESLDTPECRRAAAEWLQHKVENNKSYKSAKSFELKLQEWAARGPPAFIEAVRFSIGNNYQGIFPPGKQHGRSSAERTPSTRRADEHRGDSF